MKCLVHDVPRIAIRVVVLCRRWGRGGEFGWLRKQITYVPLRNLSAGGPNPTSTFYRPEAQHSEFRPRCVSRTTGNGKAVGDEAFDRANLERYLGRRRSGLVSLELAL